MQKKRWDDLSICQQIGVIVGATMQVGLLVLGLWDVAHRTADEVRGDRRMWAGLMFINWIGPIVYFTYGRKDSPLLNCCRKTEEPELIEETADTEGVTELGGTASV